MNNRLHQSNVARRLFGPSQMVLIRLLIVLCDSNASNAHIVAVNRKLKD